MKTENQSHTSSRFANKVWTTVSITAFVAIMILIIYKTFNAFLLLLAASLIALFFAAISGKIKKWTGWKDGISLTVTIALMVIVVGLFFWLLGAEAQNQYQEMQKAVPVIIENAQEYLNKSDVEKKYRNMLPILRIKRKFCLFCKGSLNLRLVCLAIYTL